MTQLKSLAKDTAIYGLSSIVGRFLNYLLTPLYTIYVFTAESGNYGVISNLYAHTAFLLVLLTFGMETTFFRFMNEKSENAERVYATTLFTVGTVNLLFLGLTLTFLHPISTLLRYPDHPQYVAMMAIIVAVDAFQSILFAYLRYQRRPLKFMCIKLVFIVTNIGLNLIFFLLMPTLYAKNPEWIGTFYNPNLGVGYVFGLNMVCTLACTCFFFPELSRFKFVFDTTLIKRMLSYSWPILILGIAGILNQTADKMILPNMIGGKEGEVQLGIYAACAKVAMVMAMIMQAFRYAYEPFVFGQATSKDNKKMYATAMKYFVIFTLFAFLLVMGYLDIFKLLIGKDYWEGLYIVPIVMVAEILMGIYFNLSFWYKLTDKTIWGALFSSIGCLVLIVINLLFIPRYGYVACAWGGVAGYGTAMLLSYFVGQKKYPIKYPLRSIGGYVLLTVLLYGLMQMLPSTWPPVFRIGTNTVLILFFIIYLVKRDFPLSQLPLIGQYFKHK